MRPERGKYGLLGPGSLLPSLGLLLAASGFLTPVVNPDLYWHLSAGRLMAETLSVPRADWLSHTLPGAPWVDFEWLTQLAYYAVHSLAGCAGIIGLRALVLTLAVWVVSRLLALQGLGPSARGLAALWLGAALLPVSDARPDNFSLLFFALTLYGLEAERLGRWKPKPSQAWLTGLFFCVWANMHLGFLYGLALVGLYAAGSAAETWHRSLLVPVPGTGAERGPGYARCRWLAGMAAVGAAAGLLNPYGWRLYKVAFDHAALMGFIKSALLEWTPPFISIRPFWPYWALLAASFAAALAHFAATRRTPYAHILAILAFGLSSAACRRMTGFFAVAAAPVLFPILLEAGRLPLAGRNAARLRRGLWAAGVLGAVLLANDLASVAWLSMAPGSPWAWCGTPGARVARFLQDESAELGGKRLYNGWAHGGYFGFALHPAYKVFFDGRYIFLGLLRESMEAQAGPERWQAFLERHRVEVATLKRDFGGPAPATAPSAAPGRPGSPAGARPAAQTLGPARPLQEFMPRGDWALVYYDDINMVLVRRSAASARWLAAKEILRPLPILSGGGTPAPMTPGAVSP